MDAKQDCSPNSSAAEKFAVGHSRLRASAREWGVSVSLAGWVFWLPLAASAALLAAPLLYEWLGSDGRWFYRRTFEIAVAEDGPVEWCQVLLFVVAGLTACSIARRLRASRSPRQAAWFLVVALGFLLVVCEELSWGQRLLGLATPEWLVEINRQDELNVHNISSVQGWLDYPRVLVSLWGTFGFLIVRRLAATRAFSRAAFPLAPPALSSSSFAVMLAYDLLRASLWSEPGFFLRLMRYGEWPELCLSFGLCAFLVLGRRRMACWEDREGTEAPSFPRQQRNRRSA